MRIAFGDLPIGARFTENLQWSTIVCIKVSARAYRATFSKYDTKYHKSPGVYVDCIECDLRLAVLRARQQRIDQ